jgi:PAS domain S-box-containing protein
MEILKKPYRILVVDDDEEDYLLISDFLSELGKNHYSYEWASSFSEGSRLMKEARHDIYLIDHFLGAGTGIELISDATANGCRTPKILLTGVGNLEIDMQAIRAGAYDYLPKTLLSTEMLERTLRHAVERYEQNLLFENQQARFKNLFEQSIDPIYITDDHWNFTEANNSLVDLFKLEHAQLSYKKLRDLFVEESAFHTFLEQMQQYGYVINFACLMQVQDSEKKMICLLSCSPIVDVQKNIVGYQGMIRDITQLKKAERELMQIEHMNLTGRMARIIAHEVRNPLTNINLATGEMEIFIQQQEEAGLYIDIIKRSSERINNLISDLLNSTRLANPVIVNCEIEKIFDDVILLCNDRIQLKKIKLKKSGLNGSTWLKLDKEKIKIAFINIITNSIEAMEQTVEPELKIELNKLDKEVQIKISDNGCGMDDHTQKHLFDAFFTGKSGGMGLGMTTVQNIILQHQGNIQVESEVNKGTSFLIQLPSL